MARKVGLGCGKAKGDKAARRLSSSDFVVDLDKPDPSPLEFINRRMAEEDGKDGD